MRTIECLQTTASHFRKLSLALTVAAVALIASSTRAEAQEPVAPTDPGVRCAAKVGPGQYEFYLPGEKATDVNGNKWVCGPDGQWFRDYSALTLGTGTKAYPTHLVYQVVSYAALIR